MVFRVCLLVCCLSASNCLQNGYALSGHWQAVAYRTLADSTTVLPADTLRLILSDEGWYRYDGAAHYREYGRYRTTWHYLFLNDTMHSPKPEYVLKINALEKDTLILEMKNNGVPAWLTMVRMP
ncbi:MAG: hypothetical protein ACOYNO_10560 [Saprospiraceae bacterium]